MAIKLPEKPFHTIPELRKKWECTDDDIRHLIVTGAIKPSYFIRDLAGHMVSFKDDDFLGDGIEVDGYEFHTGTGPDVSGYHYLQEPFQEAPLECTFYLFSSQRDTPKTEDSGGYWGRLDNGIGLAEVMERGVVMNTEVARFEAAEGVAKEKPLGKRERDTLLTIIAAMAVKGLKLNIDEPGLAAGFISGLTDENGTHVSKRIIEKHLKVVPAALEVRLK